MEERARHTLADAMAEEVGHRPKKQQEPTHTEMSRWGDEATGGGPETG